MEQRITIMEKPDWISYDDIAEVLHEAHRENVKKGLIYSASHLSGEEIQALLHENGKFYVALTDDNELVGAVIGLQTAAHFDNRVRHGQRDGFFIIPLFAGDFTVFVGQHHIQKHRAVFGVLFLAGFDQADSFQLAGIANSVELQSSTNFHKFSYGSIIIFS